MNNQKCEIINYGIWLCAVNTSFFATKIFRKSGLLIDL